MAGRRNVGISARKSRLCRVHPDGVPAPLPSVADIGYSLAFLGLFGSGLALRRERHRHDVRIILDVILGFLGAVVLASVLLRPVIETLLQTTSSGLLAATLSQISYPCSTWLCWQCSWARSH